MAIVVPSMGRALSFGAVMLASSAMQNVFVTYYIAFFQLFSLSPNAFYVGQVWNAVNDPLFGWLSDTLGDRDSRRFTAIRVGGGLWCLAFVVTWLPVAPSSPLLSGLHFTFALCFYDGMLTYVELNLSALLAEITASATERAQCNMWAAVGAGLGSVTSFLAYVVWDGGDLLPFRWLSVGIAGVCWAVFEVAARGLRGTAGASSAAAAVLPDDDAQVLQDGARHRSPASLVTRHTSPNGDGPCADCITSPGASALMEGSVERGAKPGEAKPALPYLQFVGELLHHRNFLIFAAISTLQVFDCTFEKNFFSLFLDSLTGHAVSAGSRGAIVSAAFLLPHACTVIMTPAIKSLGLYRVVHLVFYTRLGLLLLACGVGRSSPWAVCMFIMVNRVTSESVCRLTPLIVSDLVDEDSYLNKRSRAMSASVVGSVAFVSKFSQSLAPMLGVAVLPDSNPTDASNTLLWWFLLGVPLACVVVQMVLWRTYTLHGVYLKEIKQWTSKSAA